MTAELPTGTVTFLFTDVEGSTRLLRELGSAYEATLAEHRRVLREAVERQGGAEVDTQGDALFAAFGSASAALAAAAAAQEALDVPVRMGIHTGEAEVTGEGYVGLEVHRAARICAVAHGGQVVVSAQAVALAGDGAGLQRLGEHRLKDFDEPVILYQLGREPFPPLRTVSNTNLPRPASSFVGRDAEVRELAALLSDGARLLTLTGPGGSGKTRLAIEAASEVVPEFQGGVFWVPLAPIRDPALVTDTIAGTLGASGGLADHIGERELLLVVDNLEQVVEAAPELASLAEACPNLTVLVTSRELLRVRGEVEYAVQPLAGAEAIELFCDRAQLDPDGAVAELCRRLDNLPLAVELAAARTRILSPEEILERVAGRFDLLRGGRDAEARQQTLRAASEWSYDLLPPAEQRLFARLAVFVGGCTLDAAEEVADAEIDDLQELVDKSLLRRSGGRFSMLETIHEYARERLEQSGEAPALHERHAEYFLGVTESARLTPEWYEHHPERIAGDIDNLRAAIARSRDSGDVELALRIAAAAEHYWAFTNPDEGVRWYAELLEAAPDLPLELRARALRACGSCANPAGDDALAERCYEESLAAFQALGDERGIAHLLLRLGSSALYRGDLERARGLTAESLDRSRGVGDRATEALCLGVAGDVEQSLGNGQAGIELTRASADLAREIGLSWQLTRMLRRLADWELAHGDLADAGQTLAESLRLSRELGDRISIVFTLARVARLEAEHGRLERAGRIWGTIETEEESGSLGAWYGERERFAGPLLERAGEDFERGRADGWKLPLDGAVEEALGAA